MLLLVLTFTGCTKPDPDPDPTPPPTVIPEKKRLLFFYSGTVNGGSYGRLEYDSTGKLISFNRVNSGDYKVYFSNGMLHHILDPITTFNSLFQRGSWIFLYNADKKCIKVLRKYAENYDGSVMADNNPFFTNENDGKANMSDSIVYTGSGQLKEIWTPAGGGGNHYIVSVFNYTDQNESQPTEIVDYTGVGTTVAQLNLVYKTVFTYSNNEQPVNRNCWFFSFLQWNVFPVAPIPPASYSARFLPLLNKTIRKFSLVDYTVQPTYVFNSKNFLYQYNADSTSFTGRYDPDDITYDKMEYKFVVKEIQ